MKNQTDSGWSYRPLLFMVICTIGLVYAWASYYEIEQHVRGSGRIVPSGQAKIIQHLEGGIVNEILVKEGQQVNNGDVLLQISNQRAISDLEEQRIALDALHIKILRLQTEYKGGDVLDFGEYETIDGMSEIIQSERRLFSSRQQGLKEKVSVLESQIQQKMLKIEDMKTQLSSLREEKSVSEKQLSINSRLRKSGAISETKYLDTKSRVVGFNTRIEKVKKTIPVTNSEIQEIKQKIISEKENYKTEVLDEINKIELSIQQLEERIKTNFDEVKRTDLLSPVRGIVNKLLVNTIGGVIQPGEALIEITPLGDNLIVEARVLTKDRGLIWNGLPATIKITAYDYAIYGGLDGTVTEISADSFTDESGIQYYRVRINIETSQLKDYQTIYPGMTVEANILSGKKSILHSLMKPLWRVQQNALREP